MADLSFLGRKWVKKILFNLEYSRKSFTELKRELGISTKVLSDNLRLLRETNLVKREVMEDRTTIYFLTERGKRILELIKEIEKSL